MNLHPKIKATCRRGHIRTDENTYMFMGRTECRDCRSQVAKERWAKQKAQTKGE